MATDADLTDFKADLYNGLIDNREFECLMVQPEFLELLTCTEESKGWPRSPAEVSIDLIDEYMDHAEQCVYHAQLMLLEQRDMDQELRLIFRLARGLDNQGRLLRGTELIEAIAENERRLASWKREREATIFPFTRIALYNGPREVASCGSFFDFSRHESVNELDPQAGLQIRGSNGREEQDVLLGSYALAGVRHEGEEQVLPLMNGYTVGLRVNRLDEKMFAIGFRCVESETIEMKDGLRKQTRRAPAAWSMGLERTRLALVNCGQAVHWSLESRTKSFWKAFTERPNVVQLCTTLLLLGLLFKAVGYLRQPHIYTGSRMTGAWISPLYSSLVLSEKVTWFNPASNEVALDAQSLFLYSNSDLEQMVTVERLIAGSSYGDQNVEIVSRVSRVAKNRKKITVRRFSRRHRRAKQCGTVPTHDH